MQVYLPIAEMSVDALLLLGIGFKRQFTPVMGDARCV